MPALTCPRRVVENPEHPPLRITQSYIDRLEGWCDDFNEPLPALNSFVLPGGTPLSALLHVARTVTRRAERSAWLAIDAIPTASACCRRSTSTGCRICCSFFAAVANPGGDVLWQPGG